MKYFKFINILAGLLFIAFGIYLWGNSVQSLSSISVWLGVGCAAFAAIVFFIHLYFRLRPIPYTCFLMSAVVSAILIVLNVIQIDYLLWAMIGAFLASAVYYLLKLLKHKDGENSKKNIMQLTLVIFVLSYGVIMLFYPEMALSTLSKVVAIGTVMNGVSYLVNYKVEHMPKASKSVESPAVTDTNEQ